MGGSETRPYMMGGHAGPPLQIRAPQDFGELSRGAARLNKRAGHFDFGFGISDCGFL
jgi:hypothetical protein